MVFSLLSAHIIQWLGYLVVAEEWLDVAQLMLVTKRSLEPEFDSQCGHEKLLYFPNLDSQEFPSEPMFSWIQSGLPSHILSLSRCQMPENDSLFLIRCIRFENKCDVFSRLLGEVNWRVQIYQSFFMYVSKHTKLVSRLVKENVLYFVTAEQTEC